MRTLFNRVGQGMWAFAFFGLVICARLRAQQADDASRRDDIHRSQQNLATISRAIQKMGGKEFTTAKYPAGFSDQEGKLILSWRVAILPAIGEKKLFDQFRLDEPWDSENNHKLIAKMPKIYQPVRGKTEEGYTYFRGFAGEQAMFPTQAKPAEKAQIDNRWCYPVYSKPLGKVLDGTSNTLLIVEAGDAVPWTKPEELVYDPKQPLPKIGGLFEGDFNALLCDGAVQLLPGSMPEKALRAAITPAGGEDVKLWKFVADQDVDQKHLVKTPPAAALSPAARHASMYNLKSIALALLNYADAQEYLPTRAIFDKNGTPLLSWRVRILPWLGDADLYKQIRLDEPWDSENNKKLLNKMPEVFSDPQTKLDPGMTVYQAVVGPGMAFEGNLKLKVADMSDGTDKTVGVVEVAADHAVPWTKPADWEIDPNDPSKGLANVGPKGAFLAMFLDGHIEEVPFKTKPEQLKAMFTRKAGD